MNLDITTKREELEKWTRELDSELNQLEDELDAANKEIAKLRLRQTVLGDAIDFSKIQQRHFIVPKLEEEYRNIGSLVEQKEKQVDEARNNLNQLQQYTQTLTDVINTILEQQLKR
ncbi:hypothetical protein skT53_14490 [Effusibacillus dendaii]|uniref:Uncharacterized protein n=2 Tax=Effusibacillus dendaii TaxID=2743772 RepID=A0A7I8D8L1_9BACL|nr:hypothetical protein skT53_14490 [Effusibacillus dendaii]